MGHTWREIDPVGAEKHDKYMDHLIELRKRLEGVPISMFTCCELESLMKVLGLMHTSTGEARPTEHDFSVIEGRLSQLK